MATGYKLADGRDFSDVFTAGDAGLVTGYCTSGGTDVGRQFMSGSSGIVTGYKNPAGIDLGSLLGYDEYLSQGYELCYITVASRTEYVNSGDDGYYRYSYGAEMDYSGSAYQYGSASPSGYYVYGWWPDNNTGIHYVECGKQTGKKLVGATAIVFNGTAWLIRSAGTVYGNANGEYSQLAALVGQTVPVYMKF